MSREVHCGPPDFEPVVRSEWSRGNAGGAFRRTPHDLGAHMKHPLDLEAVLAEFELPDCIQVNRLPDGSTALACRLTRVALGGGPTGRGWLGRRQQRRWWQEQARAPRPRRVFAPRDEA